MNVDSNFYSSKLLPKSRLAQTVGLASLVLSVALLLLPFIFKLDGKTHAEWQQFLGRFHPLVVHLPIGLLLLVPLLELVGLVRPPLQEAAGFVLSLCIPACLCAVMLGYLLAYGSGDAGTGVTRHMWGGILLTIATLVCALARSYGASGTLQGAYRVIYPATLLVVLMLLAWTAHQGGSLTHGDNYLTEHMPGPLKRVLGSVSVKAGSASAADSFYAKHVDPVFDHNCVACHGASSIKGGLRLDSFAGLMRGGEEGSVVVPGDPDRSLLLQRVTLPVDHKRFMPSEGKPPLKAEDIALLRAWIAQGASSTASSIAGVSVREEETPPPPVGDYSRMIGEIQQTAKAAGVTVVPVSRTPSDGLILNTIDASSSFGDAQLASFQKFAPFIVEVGLARTSVSDASFDTLAKFTQLRALHLEDTPVTGAGLQKLSTLAQLRYLNLSGTKVNQTAIAPLNSMKQLRHLYLYNTPAQPDTTAPTAPQPEATSKARQSL